MDTDNALTVPQAAAELGLNEVTIRRRIARQEMQAMRMGGKLWLIPRSEVEAWKARGKLTPGPKRRTA